VLLENVTGFLTSRGGSDFAAASETLSKLGYRLDAFVLNAKHFVPQSRPRVFVVGIAEGLVVPHQSRGLAIEVDATHPLSLIRLLPTLRLRTKWLGLSLPPPPTRTLSLTDVIDLDMRQDWWDDREVKRHYRMMHPRHRRRIDELREKKSTWVGTIFRRVRYGMQRAEVRFDGIAGCLRTPSGGSAKQIVVAIKNSELRMRWMSPKEYARLQGVAKFPLAAPTNELLWAFGDAVCVPAISWIDDHVLSPIFDANKLLWRPSLGRQSHSGTTTQNNGRGEGQKHVLRKNARRRPRNAALSFST
jgi:DNA (cytosine-5)-methyltransferase 1